MAVERPEMQFAFDLVIVNNAVQWDKSAMYDFRIIGEIKMNKKILKIFRFIVLLPNLKIKNLTA